MDRMNFILRVVWTSYLTSCASSELNMMFIQRAIPRPRPRLWGSKTKTKTKTPRSKTKTKNPQFQDQDQDQDFDVQHQDRDSRLTSKILEVRDWDGLWQTKRL